MSPTFHRTIDEIASKREGNKTEMEWELKSRTNRRELATMGS